MDDEVEIAVFQNLVGGFQVAEVDLVKFGLLAGDFFDLVQNFDFAVA